MTRDAKRKKASRCEEDSAQQVQASLNSVLIPMQSATCTNVGVAQGWGKLISFAQAIHSKF